METQADWQRDAPAVGREDEPEPAGGKRRGRYFKVQLPAEAMEQIEAAADGSGMYRTHFYATAVMLGVGALAAALRSGERHIGTVKG
jgi:hypothetical protein